MKLFVYKYGGTSLGSTDRIEQVASKVAKDYTKGLNILIVVSAMSGETNRLCELAHAIDPHYCGREPDALLATGEQVSAALLAIALRKQGIDAVSLTGAQIKIHTDNSFNKARITKIDDAVLRKHIKARRIVIVTGFQGVDAENNITTLGRGGSDTTAVALASRLKAEECRIYTDVDGIYTTDPRIEPKARLQPRITFEEMLEMASLGSKVLQIRAVEFAGKYNVPLRVLSSVKEGAGTLITYEEESGLERASITGIACTKDEAQLTIAGVADEPGIAARILGVIADKNIEVDMIVQNAGVHHGKADFTFTVHRRDYMNALEVLKKTKQTLNAKQIFGNDNIAKISLVGVGMRSHAGIAATMFKAMADASVNIQMISTSEIKISVVVDDKDAEKSVRILHQAFNLEQHIK